MSEIIDFDYSNIDAYQGYMQDVELLKKSSSGGAARELMRTILNQNGVIFGAKYSSDFYYAQYCYIDDVSKLNVLVGSKYIYTNKNVEVAGKKMSVSQAVAYFLEQGRKVLFIGLGCDVFAIKSFCEKKGISTNELYLIDIICQGPTFPDVEEMYIKNLEKKYKSKAIDFSVRYKKYGWYPPYIRVVFENGKEYYESFYGSDFGYAFNVYSKEMCFKCPYKGINHVSDITLGDYWGINQQDVGYNKNGVSILLVHSRKGKVLLDSIDQNLFTVRKADVKKALINNPMYYKDRKRSDKLDEFKKLMDKYGLHKAVIKQVGVFKYYFIRVIRFINKIRKELIS